MPARRSYAAARRLDRLEVLAKELDGPDRPGTVSGRCDVTSEDDRRSTRRPASRPITATSTCSSTTPVEPGPPDAETGDRRGLRRHCSTSTCRRDSTSRSPWSHDRGRRPDALHHQHLVGHRAGVDRADRRRRLCRLQGRRHRPQPRARRPVGAARHTRQHHRPGLVRHRDDRRAVHQRRIGRLGPAQHDARPRRRTTARSTARCCSWARTPRRTSPATPSSSTEGGRPDDHERTIQS